MAKIEDIVYDAIDLGLYEELLSKVSELRFKYNRRVQLSDLYEEALNDLSDSKPEISEINKLYIDEEEKSYENGSKGTKEL